MAAPIQISVMPRYSDLDALGHVNYAVYLSYLEEAFLVLWQHVQRAVGFHATDTDLGCVTARAEVDYRSPAGRAPLEVSVWLSGVGRTSFSTSYRIREAQSERLIAEGKTVQVITSRLDGQARSRIIEYLNDLVGTESEGGES